MRRIGNFVCRFMAAAVVLVAMQLFMAAPAMAQFSVAPAQPQPDAAALRPGLSVDYAYGEVKWLDEAASWVGYAKPGSPLEGFVYGDTTVGENALTSESSEYVIAFIKGFMRFEAGSYELEFQSNDGLRVTLGGVQIYEHDGRHTCGTKGIVRIDVPTTAWYPVQALFFQRKFTSCLDLSIRPSGGEWDFTNPEMYARLPQ